MANEFIELLHTYDAKIWKRPYNWYCQVKIDGVPARCINAGGNIVSYSRQSEQYTSIRHIEGVLKYILLELGGSCVGELHMAGKPFKEISGMVRRDAASPTLVYHVFDADILNRPDTSYSIRIAQFEVAIARYCEAAGIATTDCPVRLVRSIPISDELGFNAVRDTVMGAYPKTEGLVLHRADKPFQPGKRCWETIKWKPTPTLDLIVTGFEEAIDGKTKLGKGMVGRINCELTRMDALGNLTTTVVGVGPGALKHNERIALWLSRSEFRGRVAEVQYMADDSYGALRQPTFVRWRDDKKEGQIYAP